MDVTAIPFNHFIGIEHSDKPEYLLMLRRSPNLLNHLGTMHASAQSALAEATSGVCLLSSFKEQIASTVAVVRRCDMKFSKPAQGSLYASARLDGDRAQIVADVEGKGRALIHIEVEVHDAEGNRTMSASFDWFVSLRSPRVS